MGNVNFLTIGISPSMVGSGHIIGSLDGGKAKGISNPGYLGLESLGFLEVRVRGFRFRRRGSSGMGHFFV